MVVNTGNAKTSKGVDIAKVWFRPFSEDFINLIIKKGDVLNAAGSFTRGDSLFEPFIIRQEGDKDSIIGLPKKLTKRLIEEVIE